MARTVAQIQASILANMAANPNLTYVDDNNITHPITDNTSMYAIFNAFAHCVALAQAVLEQLMDLYVTNIEAMVARSAAASALWIQDKMFSFQYSVANPQIVQLINGIPQYPAIDKSLRIITACAISKDLTNTVNVKCATGLPLGPLDDLQLAAAQSYIDLIGVDGVNYVAISLNPDLIYIEGNIFYNGMYSSVLPGAGGTAIAAINTWLQNLSKTNFDGSLKISDLENMIRNITGVTDVVLKNVYIRRDADTPPSTGPTGTALIVSQNSPPQLINRIYNSPPNAASAGYIVSETTTGFTLTDSLTFIAQ